MYYRTDRYKYEESDYCQPCYVPEAAPSAATDFGLHGHCDTVKQAEPLDSLESKLYKEYAVLLITKRVLFISFKVIVEKNLDQKWSKRLVDPVYPELVLLRSQEIFVEVLWNFLGT